MCKERLGLQGFWKHRSWVAVYFTDYKFGNIRRRRFVSNICTLLLCTRQTEVSVNLLPNTKTRVINIATLSDHWINRVEQEQQPFKCEKVDPGRQTFCDAPKIFCALMTWQQGGIFFQFSVWYLPSSADGNGFDILHYLADVVSSNWNRIAKLLHILFDNRVGNLPNWNSHTAAWK